MSFLLGKYPKSLSLDVNSENQKALNFYTKLGFKREKEYFVLERSGFIKFESPYPGFKIEEWKKKEEKSGTIEQH